MLHNPHYATQLSRLVLMPCAFALSAGLLVGCWLIRIVAPCYWFAFAEDCTFAPFAPFAACAALRASVLRFLAATLAACAALAWPATAKPLRVLVAPPFFPIAEK